MLSKYWLICYYNVNVIVYIYIQNYTGFYKHNAYKRSEANISGKIKYILQLPLSLTCHINTPNKTTDADWI